MALSRTSIWFTVLFLSIGVSLSILKVPLIHAVLLAAVATYSIDILVSLKTGRSAQLLTPFLDSGAVSLEVDKKGFLARSLQKVLIIALAVTLYLYIRNVI
jgi:hypothetical protein